MAQTKMVPRISGGTRVGAFNNEPRARWSLTVSPLPYAIRFSKALIETAGWSCQDSETQRNVLIHTDDNVSLPSRARSRYLWEGNKTAGQKGDGRTWGRRLPRRPDRVHSQSLSEDWGSVPRFL